ncbi:bifunctional glycosyltransferase family 2 protein/CDP-glycerol:glycerophosphate glycerophosphotransferase [Streptomyces sp. NPDC020719]|uniref:bifunctional glycosyltransferase/CDP-glycerol:glycerophosphate glycerophosphotransferase n=1 Tax=Streptomyces sp. NPDC020719 TaxID=3154896 RepID=UPI0033CC997B
MSRSRPLFSVVVPVHRVRGFLRETLESVLGQSYGGLELIVVDDRSPDGCGVITAESAEADARVVPLALSAHRGPGPARNAGAAHACGEYLLFLDGDDLLLPGALQALAERLRDGGGALDVLRFGHERSDWRERVTPGGPPFPDAPSPPVAWDRLLRRTFWLRHGLAFTDGPYEEIVPVVRAERLVAEGRAASLDRVCVRVRERRAGGFAATPGRGHFRVLEAYAPLLAADPGLRPTAAAHLRAVRDDPGRIRPADRRAFHRAADHLLGGALGPYAVHRVQLAIDQQKGKAWELAGRARKSARGRILRTAYRVELCRPLDPDLVVHGAYWNRGVACNPAAVHAKARELAPQLRHLWVVGARHAGRLPPGTEHVVAGSRAYWRAMATAAYLVNNSSFPGGFTKRPGQVYLQTHHGTPLKSMGLDQRRYPALAATMDFDKILAHVDQWDFSLSANPHSTEIWERVYPSSSYTHLDLGYPRNDRYFTATSDEIAGIRASLGIEPGRRAILYAPTHRDRRTDGFASPLDLDAFVRELGDEYVVLVRAHYFHGTSAALPEHPGLLDVTGHPRVEDLCLAADALVTDYSSLMFDYACLDRPIVVHAPDWAAYRATRGTYFDLLSGCPGETPGALATSDDELIGLFREGGWDTDATDKLRAAFRARFCPYDDGRAAERVVRRVFLGEEMPLSPEARPPAPSPGWTG